jgi:hypothetical protein
VSIRIRSDEKNLAFSDQPKPLTAADAKRRLKAAPAKDARADVELSMFLPAAGEMQVDQKATRTGGVSLLVRPEKLGTHVFPPAGRLKAVKPLGDLARRGSRKALTVEGVRPRHLAFRPTPRSVPAALR